MVILIIRISFLAPKHKGHKNPQNKQWRKGVLIRSWNKTYHPGEERNKGWIWQLCHASGEIQMWVTGNISQVHRAHREGTSANDI